MSERHELLEPGELAEQGPPEAVRLPLDLIDSNPNNPRGTLPEVDLLADNIRAFGLLQPIIVRRVTHSNGDGDIYLLPCKHAVLVPRSSGTPQDSSTAKVLSGEPLSQTTPVEITRSASDSPTRTTARTSAAGSSRRGGADWSIETAGRTELSKAAKQASASGSGKSPVVVNFNLSSTPVCPYCGSNAAQPSPQLKLSMSGPVAPEAGSGGATGKMIFSEITTTSWTERWPSSWKIAPQAKSREDATNLGYTVVTQDGGLFSDRSRYELLGGHRRMAAFQMLRDIRDPLNVAWRTIPAVVTTADDDKAYLMLISTQVHHQDWKPKEEASALERLLATGRSLRQIGEVLSRDESWASKRLRIYSDSILSGYVQSGKIGRAVAEEFLSVRDAAQKRELAERATTEEWSQRQARDAVRALRLDRQLREVARRAHELLELLSMIDRTKLPPEAIADLWSLRGRIIAIGRGPVIPPLEQVGIPQPERRGRPRRAGYKPRL